MKYNNEASSCFNDGFNLLFRYLAKDNKTLSFYINETKKTVALKNNLNCEVVVIKCHEKDPFDVEIGCGLALSKLMTGYKPFKVMREFFRDSKRKLDYKKYAKWVLLSFFCYDYNREKFLKGQLLGKSSYEVKEIRN